MRNLAKAVSLSLLCSGAAFAQSAELTAGVASAADRLADIAVLPVVESSQSASSTLQAEYRGAQFVVAETSSQALFSSDKHQVLTVVERSQELWGKAFARAESHDRINFGAEYRYQDFWGTVAVSLVSELSDRARGEYGKVSYRYPIQVGSAFEVSPELSFTYMNGEYFEQYLGMHGSRAEDAEGPGATSKVSVGVGAKQGLTDSWQLNYNAAVGVLEPVDNSTEAAMYEYSLGVGVAYSF